MFHLKRIPFMVLVLALALMTVTACTGKSATTQPSTSAVITTTQMTTAMTSSSKATTTVNPTTTPTTKSYVTPLTTIPGITIESGAGEGKSASLPAGYPADLFPVYKDSYILGVVTSGGSYTIMAESKDDWNVVADFYKDVLKKAQVTSSTDTATSFTSFGKIGSYTYSFDTAKNDQPEMEGYKTSIMIMLMP